ncbi:hypothetical protein ACE1CD_18000 [Aerosakkonema sp. BLCC-F183]
MISSIQMQAVIEVPYYEGDFLCPWETPEFIPFSKIRLCAEMGYPQIGLVFAQLAQYNRIELTADRQTVLRQILKAKSLVLPGGIQVVCQKRGTISPSCCCGLESWREWIDVLKTGTSPWLGHDPSPWIEITGDVVRVWSDGGIMQVNDAFYIDISRTHFEELLRLVKRDLEGFLFCIESWAREIGFVESKELVHKFDECFSIMKNKDFRGQLL